jgi:origin recognition complex subunit 5
MAGEETMVAPLHRESQIEQLQSLFGAPGISPCESVFAYGDYATGKTTTIRHVLVHGGIPHAFINMEEALTPQLLFEGILNQISGVVPSRENSFYGYCRCDHISVFMRKIVQVYDEVYYLQEPAII